MNSNEQEPKVDIDAIVANETKPLERKLQEMGMQTANLENENRLLRKALNEQQLELKLTIADLVILMLGKIKK